MNATLAFRKSLKIRKE